jgi:KDO2-lipid IV(A) lauroyltransferase
MEKAGYHFHTVVRPFGDPLRERMYENYRAKQGQLFIPSHPPSETLKRILQALKKNEIVLLITDENKRHGGVFVDFFDRPASTASGPAVIHLRTGADLLPMFLIRNHNNTHDFIIEPALTVSDKDGQKASAEEITQLITNKIEEYVRKYPAQWMWTQRRWKTRPPEEKAQGVDHVYRDY